MELAMRLFALLQSSEGGVVFVLKIFNFVYLECDFGNTFCTSDIETVNSQTQIIFILHGFLKI